MSSVRYALEKLDFAVSKLDESVVDLEAAFESFEPQQVDPTNVIDVDFMAMRLDRAIHTVEALLKQEG